MPSMNLLITNDLTTYGQAVIAKMDMIIAITDDGKLFSIGKNRYGSTSNGGPGLPISILPQVIAKPAGQIVVDWK